MAENAEWSADANQAVMISLMQAGLEGQPRILTTFNPKFTYPIFGDAETIFGYKNLVVGIRFAAHDMKPNLEITYDEEFKAVGEIKPDDIRKVLSDWLLPIAFESPASFIKSIHEDDSSKSFVPAGKLVEKYQLGERHFEVWKGDLMDASMQQVITRMQIFVPFFIEGGTMLRMDDPEWSLQRWVVYLLYEKRQDSKGIAPPYSFVGYSTVYRFFHFSRGSSKTAMMHKTIKIPYPHPLHVDDIPCKARISQFIILPPYQGFGHGNNLYNVITEDFRNLLHVFEFTVEDPNEAFDDLRDYCDLACLRTDPDFIALRIDTTVQIPRIGPMPTKKLLPAETLIKIQRRYKIAGRQFARLVEMQLLSTIPISSRNVARTTQRSKAANPDDRAYYAWRMLTKQRLYRHNKDSLIQLELEERKEKLEEVLETVENEYVRLLRGAERHEKRVQAQKAAKEKAAKDAAGEEALARSERKSRRRVVIDNDDDGHPAVITIEDDSSTAESSHRKRRRLD
ncbi:MAG: histone acetyltransferase 1 [Trizodia sp. TS-e1964]|nr:MAG: histone acetyltransferase 1 [Trizodia sp. TS-e1964]